VCVLAAAALAGLAGCSSPSGGRLSLFPEAHKLIEPAKVLREVSCPPPDIARELDKVVAGPYTVEPGDVLLAQPATLDSPVRLPGDQPVLPDGTIQLGRYGRVQVAGKCVDAIQMEVNAFIHAQVPECGPIVVRLVTRDSKLFYVLGEVNAPGAFPLKGRETVLDAIVAAGGLNSNASRRGIILTRPTAPNSCRIVLPVRYNSIVQLGDTTTNYQIRCGDRVYVPSKSLWDDIKACFEKKKHEPECPPPVPCFPCAASLGAPCKGPLPVEAPPAPEEEPREGPILFDPAATIGPVRSARPDAEPEPATPRPAATLGRPGPAAAAP
jgi:protein involved in polysaccharide export with SLBB domain